MCTHMPVWCDGGGGDGVVLVVGADGIIFVSKGLG